jgi:environmental stress-induced protein Ves
VAQVCALELHECSIACHIFAGDAYINVAVNGSVAVLKLWMRLQCGAAQYQQNIANHTTAVARQPYHTLLFCMLARSEQLFQERKHDLQ